MAHVSYDYHRSIIVYFIAKMKEFVAEKRITRVEEDEKTKMTEFPFAFVIPRRVPIADLTVGTVEWQPSVDVVIVEKDPDVAAGRQKVLKLGWDTYDKFMADRQMGGLGELYPQLIEPDYEPQPEFVLHWVLVRFEVHVERTG